MTLNEYFKLQLEILDYYFRSHDLEILQHWGEKFSSKKTKSIHYFIYFSQLLITTTSEFFTHSFCLRIEARNFWMINAMRCHAILSAIAAFETYSLRNSVHERNIYMFPLKRTILVIKIAPRVLVTRKLIARPLYNRNRTEEFRRSFINSTRHRGKRQPVVSRTAHCHAQRTRRLIFAGVLSY